MIIPELAASKRSNVGTGSVVKSVKELKHLLGSNSDSISGSISVPMPVLAMMFNKTNNSNANSNQSNNDKKRKVDNSKEEVRKKQALEKVKEHQDLSGKTDKAVKIETEKSVEDAEKGEAKKSIKRLCYAFEKGEKCRYGARCHFRHSA